MVNSAGAVETRCMTKSGSNLTRSPSTWQPTSTSWRRAVSSRKSIPVSARTLSEALWMASSSSSETLRSGSNGRRGWVHGGCSATTSRVLVRPLRRPRRPPVIGAFLFSGCLRSPVSLRRLSNRFRRTSEVRSQVLPYRYRIVLGGEVQLVALIRVGPGHVDVQHHAKTRLR